VDETADLYLQENFPNTVTVKISPKADTEGAKDYINQQQAPQLNHNTHFPAMSSIETPSDLFATQEQVLQALAVETAISLAHGHRIMKLAEVNPTRQVPVTLASAQGVLVGIGSVPDNPEGIAKLGILHATLTVSVNGQAHPVEGEAYVQFSYPTANPTLRDTLAELQQPPNSSVAGANILAGNFDRDSTATDRAEVDQATLDSSPSSPDTTSTTPVSPSLRASSGELEGEERGMWYPLINKTTNLPCETETPASVCFASVAGPIPPFTRPPLPTRLRQEPTVLETHSPNTPEHGRPRVRVERTTRLSSGSPQTRRTLPLLETPFPQPMDNVPGPGLGAPSQAVSIFDEDTPKPAQLTSAVSKHDGRVVPTFGHIEYAPECVKHAPQALEPFKTVPLTPGHVDNASHALKRDGRILPTSGCVGYAPEHVEHVVQAP